MVQVGELINQKYRLLRLIGEGGMGSVYEARHELLGTHVALKFLHPEIAHQYSLKERFLQEARVSATVLSPHIVRVSDVDTSGDAAYLVMELLSGHSLQAQLERDVRLPISQAVQYTLQILQGLQHAHEGGVVHRDLKPDNVFITPAQPTPLIKLLDFGIAKLRQSEEYQMTLTRPGSIMGTPEYMAPEQAYSADLVDARSDIYAVGVMLFQMLSGRRPAEGDSPQAIAHLVLTGQVLRLRDLCPELPEGLLAAVERATAANPNERWGSALEMLEALRPFAHSRAFLEPIGPGATVPIAAFTATRRTPVLEEPDPARGSLQRAAVSEPTARIATSELPSQQRAASAPMAGPAGHTIQMSGAPVVNAPAETTEPARVQPPRRRRWWAYTVSALALMAAAAGAGWYWHLSLPNDPLPPPPPRPVRKSQLSSLSSHLHPHHVGSSHVTAACSDWNRNGKISQPGSAKLVEPHVRVVERFFRQADIDRNTRLRCSVHI